MSCRGRPSLTGMQDVLQEESRKEKMRENRNKKKLKTFTYVQDAIICCDMFPVSILEVALCNKLGNNAGRYCKVNL